MKLPVSAECPNCKKVLDSIKAMDGVDALPNANDITICVGCSSVLYYNEDLSLGLIHEEDYENMDQETKNHISNAQQYLKNLKRNG